MSTIAKGVVQIDGKDNTQKAFQQVKSNTDKLATAMKAAAAAIALVAGAKALGKMITETLDAADAVGKLARNTGMSTEYVQLMSKALQEGGASANAADAAMLTFNRRLGKAREEQGALYGYLNKTNPALMEQVAAAKSTEEAMRMMVYAIESIEDPAEKAAVAAAAFGDGFGQIAGSMFAVKGGTDAAMAEIQKTTKVFTKEQTEMAEKANDLMGRVGDAWTTAKNTIIVGAAEPIVKAMEWILNEGYPKVQEFMTLIGNAWATYGKPGWDLLLEFFGNLWSAVQPALNILKEGIEVSMLVIGKAWESVKPFIDSFASAITVAWEIVQPVLSVLEKYFSATFGNIGELLSNTLGFIRDWATGTKTFTEAAQATWESFKSAFNKQIDAIINLVKGLSAPIKGAIDEVLKIFTAFIDKAKEVVDKVSGFFNKFNPFKKVKDDAQSDLGDATKTVKSELDAMSAEADTWSKKFATGISSAFASMADTGRGWMQKMRGWVKGEGEGIKYDALTDPWMLDFHDGVIKEYNDMAVEAKAAMEDQRSYVNAVGEALARDEQARLQKQLAEQRYAYGAMSKAADSFVDDVGNIFQGAFEDLFKGDIKGAWNTLMNGMKDYAIKTAAEIASAWTKDALFGGIGGGEGLTDMLKKAAGGMFSGGGGAGGGIGTKIAGLFKGGLGGGGTSSGVVGAGGGGLSMGAMAGAAVPLAIFALGRKKMLDSAKKNKAEYESILTDHTMKEKMAIKEIESSYIDLGKKGDTTYMQLSGAAAKHMSATYKGVDAIKGQTDEYGNMIVKVKDADAFVKDLAWQETHLEALDSLKQLSDHYGKTGAIGSEATLRIDGTMKNLIDSEKEAKIYADIMNQGFVSAAQALELGLPKAANLSAQEFEKMVLASNAAQTGVANLSADGISQLANLDMQSKAVQNALGNGFITSAELAKMGFRGLSDMSADMFRQMVNYAKMSQAGVAGISDGAKEAKSGLLDLGSSSNGVFNDIEQGANKTSGILGGLGKAVGGIAKGIGGIFGKLPGFQTGGQFMVGGQGGLDNNIVAFKASNNERVTVETPQQQRDGGVGGGGVVNAINGLRKDLEDLVTKPIVGAVRKQSIIMAANERH